MRTVNHSKRLYDSENTSIGIVRPTDLICSTLKLNQPTQDAPKDLAKIPFKFSYVCRWRRKGVPVWRVSGSQVWGYGMDFMRGGMRVPSRRAWGKNPLELPYGNFRWPAATGLRSEEH